MLFYIAGPLYTPAERLYLEELASAIQDLGHSTFLPHRDAGLSSGDSEDTARFFRGDLRGVDNCDVMVAVLNGYDVDSGTAFELGYAHAKRVPLLGLHEDTRLVFPKIHINLMIANSVALFDSREKLIHHLEETFGRAG